MRRMILRIVARVSRERITWMANWQLPIASYELPQVWFVNEFYYK